MMMKWKFPDDPTPAEMAARSLAIHNRIESGAEGKISGQHLVSRGLLQFFAGLGPDSRSVALVPHHLTYGPQRPTGLRGCAKLANFLWGASASAEKLWKDTVEDHLVEAVNAAQDGRIHGNEKLVRVLKDTVALHFVRSVYWRRVHNEAARRSYDFVRQALIESMPTPGGDDFRHVWGLPPATLEEKALRVEFEMELWKKQLFSGAVARTSIENRFQQFRTIFGDQRLELVRTPADSEFLISDSPAVSVRFLADEHGRGQALLRQAVGDSNTVVMPISPSCTIAISNTDRDQTLSAEQVALLNEIQVRGAYKYVYYKPGSPHREFVSNLTTTRGR